MNKLEDLENDEWITIKKNNKLINNNLINNKLINNNLINNKLINNNLINSNLINNNLINNNLINKSFNEIKNIILDNMIFNNMIKYKPEYIYVYGSRARGTNQSNSDVDIMIFWKYPYPVIEEIIKYKNNLINSLKLNVDLVNMKLTNKNIIITEEHTKCYYENVIIDAICIYDKNINNNKLNNKTLSELIECSIKMQKI